MRKATKSPGEKIVKDIKRATRKHYSAEEKIRIVLDGLRGEDSIAELCRREGISQGLYYKWSKDFIESDKSGSLVILPALPTLMRSRNFAARQRISRRWLRSRRLNCAFSKKAYSGMGTPANEVCCI